MFPAFLVLAASMLAVALAFVFLTREMHGRAMALDPEAGAGSTLGSQSFP